MRSARAYLPKPRKTMPEAAIPGLSRHRGGSGGDALDRGGRSRRARAGVEPPGDRLQARTDGRVGQQPLDGVEQLPFLEVVGAQPDAKTGLLDALRVVVLIPEQRQRDQ